MSSRDLWEEGGKETWGLPSDSAQCPPTITVPKNTSWGQDFSAFKPLDSGLRCSSSLLALSPPLLSLTV